MPARFHYRLSLFVLIFVLASCTVKSVRDVPPNYQPIFAEYDVKGCFLVYNLNADVYQIYNSARCEQGFLPASTFKILNGLIGLETGVITDENMVIPWDGVERSVPEWNRDHTFASALNYSVVPYFQEIARRIGPERMKEYVNDSDFGRMEISAETIDKFWLWGNSRITPWEQMNFILHLYTNKLPFAQEHIDLVKKLLILNKTDKWTFSGKTGMTVQDGQNIGWLVGYLEENDNVWIYVCNVESGLENTAKFKESRRAITEKIFRNMGLMQD